jgi:hypothetical protein
MTHWSRSSRFQNLFESALVKATAGLFDFCAKPLTKQYSLDGITQVCVSLGNPTLPVYSGGIAGLPT